MNQILFFKDNNSNNLNDNSENKNNKENRGFFRFQLFFSLILIIGCISYFLLNSNNLKYDKSLASTYSIKKLYATNPTVIDFTINGTTFSILGFIEISKLNINYPILSEYNDELLKVSPCKFFGPDINGIGNFCIAGHNYDNNEFFSNLSSLLVGDLVRLYDVNNNFIDYYVYDVFEVSSKDLSITNQDTSYLREVTLLTCNNLNGNRIVVKCRAYT